MALSLPPLPTFNVSHWPSYYLPSPFGPGPFDWNVAVQITDQYAWLWGSCMLLYLPVVWGLGVYMEKRQPVEVHFLLPLWNLLLAVFSTLGALHIVPVLVQQLRQDNGFMRSVCSDEVLSHTNAVWIFWFNISKIPEFLDTVFLRLRKRPVQLLQWYHHIATAAFCLYSNQMYFPGFGCPGGGRVTWFAAMNLVVHSVMYSYFFVSGIGLGKVLERVGINMLLTCMQLAQMAMGIVVLLASTRCTNLIWDPTHPHSSNFGYWIGLAMYASYFILFAKLFVDKYCVQRSDKPARVDTVAASAEAPASNGGLGAASPVPVSTHSDATPAANAQPLEAAADATNGTSGLRKRRAA